MVSLRTPIIRYHPTPGPSNACACDWKTGTDARSADPGRVDRAPTRTIPRSPCACPPLRPQHRSWSPAPAQTPTQPSATRISFSRSASLNLHELSIRRPFANTSAKPLASGCFFDRDLHQPRLALPLRPPPVIQTCVIADVVLGAILAPRHPALRKSLDDAPNLFLAPHPAIFGGILSRKQDGFLRRLRKNVTQGLPPRRCRGCCARAWRSSRFEAGALRLSDCQLVLARESGFASWPQLKVAVESVNRNLPMAFAEIACLCYDDPHYDHRSFHARAERNAAPEPLGRDGKHLVRVGCRQWPCRYGVPRR